MDNGEFTLEHPPDELEAWMDQLISEWNLQAGEVLNRFALDTVKDHNRSIYAKLEVRRRTKAVGRARELRIL